jgi:chitodextrinase
VAVISYLSTKRLRAGISLAALAAAFSVPTWAQVNACDLNSDGTVNILDVNRGVSMVLGQATCTANINGPGVCNIITVQRVVNTSLGQSCVVDSAVAGLVAAYSFSEGSGTTVADASGNGNTGTIVNATWTSSGKYGNALAFNGSTSYVDVGNSASLQLTGSMTLEAWINAAANPPDDGQIIAKSDDSAGWQFKTSPDTGPQTFGAKVSGTSSTGTQRYSSLTRSLNTWYHVASVYNPAAGTLDIYVNGVLNNGTLIGSIPASQVSQGVNVNIGRRTGGFYFNGIIDEVRVYNRALSVAEIQTDMNTPVGPTTPDTQAPTTPGSLSGIAISGTQINLGWTSSTDNLAVTGYRLERCQGAGCSNFAQIGTPSGTAYNDSSLLPSTTYSYRVRATDAAGNLSSYSNVATATTTISISHSVTLTWVASTTPSVSYNVYRSTTSGGPYTKINGSLIAGLSYVDNSVVAGQTYYYVATAVDNTSAESAYSTQVTAVIPTP